MYLFLLQGLTRLLLTKIPFFKEVILISFSCEKCGYQNNEIQRGGQTDEKGVRVVLHVQTTEDLNRQVVKSDYTAVRIPKLDFEIPSQSQKGEVTTIEGLIDRSVKGLEQDQDRRREENPETAAQIDTFIDKLKQLKEVDEPFTMVSILILEDISGNTCVENPREPQRDLGCETTQFVRTREQDHILGIYTSSELGAESQEGDGLLKSLEEGQFPLEQLEKEVLQFQTNCPECSAPCQTNMKLTDIPFFKQVVIMATNCEICGYRTNEVKTGGGIEPRGLHIEINVTGIDDFSRDVLKSETCSLLIPELDLEVGPAALGGRFSTVEGILTAMRDQIISGGGMFGDSADTHLKERFQMFFKDMDKVIRGEKHVTLVLDDPAGNSYVQSLTPPTPDDGLKITHYERTFDQNEELGLNDIKVENYEES
uniref:Zinc finger ZPR1-type domain-containing protein n=1 Tax=Timema tahoe TaxID=61484 RepID=A0A7R9NVM3_9NEOP|nr:unnamed protein product [Timema tahoe]